MEPVLPVATGARMGPAQSPAGEVSSIQPLHGPISAVGSSRRLDAPPKCPAGEAASEVSGWTLH